MGAKALLYAPILPILLVVPVTLCVGVWDLRLAYPAPVVMLTGPAKYVLVANPFSRFDVMISPPAVTAPPMVSVFPVSSASQRLPLECTLPPNLKVGSAK